VFAGVGWKLAGTAFTAFVASSGSYAAIYSGFAILILFILWVYVSWSIALAGGIIAYLVDHFATEVHRAEDEWLGERERDALRLVAIVAERHEIDAPPIELAELSRRLDRSLDVVDEMVAQLVDRRILVITATPPGIALARIPERVSVAEVLGAVSRMPRDGVASGSRAIVEVLQRRYEAGLRAVERVHVSDLLAAPGPLGAASPEVVGDPEPRSVGEAGAQRV
jgi:membrane protein